MKTIRTGALVASVASAAALALTLSPATADITSVTGNGTSTVNFTYDLDAGDRLSPSRPVLAQDPCRTSVQGGGGYRYSTATLTVSQTGSYYFEDTWFTNGRTGPTNGAFAIYAPSAPADLSATCLLLIDDGNRLTLEAGQVYNVALTTSGSGVVGSGFGFSGNGPGQITITNVADELTPEQALAACADGAPVPFGYTLLEGTARSETLTGTSGKDLIRGLGGNDTIRGLGGDDILCGGADQDTLDGGDGADFVFGEAGQDTLYGGVGADYLAGGDGQDTLYGQAGDDELFGGAGQDVLDGGAGTDVGTDTDPRSVFRSIETVNGPPAPGPQPTVTATR